jgi:alkyl hydroperoxide reductase subunit AhpC
MVNLHDDAPPFSLVGVQSGVMRRFSLREFRGRWLLLFFYPADFTFVCPTEVRAFQACLGEIQSLGAEVIGLSVDDAASHKAWAEELGGIGYPLLADPAGDVCRAYGVLNPADERAFRATFIVSPEGKVVYMVVSSMNVGRSVDETIRVLRALQTERLCPADWRPGQPTLDPALKY